MDPPGATSCVCQHYLPLRGTCRVDKAPRATADLMSQQPAPPGPLSPGGQKGEKEDKFFELVRKWCYF